MVKIDTTWMPAVTIWVVAMWLMVVWGLYE